MHLGLLYCDTWILSEESFQNLRSFCLVILLKKVRRFLVPSRVSAAHLSNSGNYWSPVHRSSLKETSGTFPICVLSSYIKMLL